MACTPLTFVAAVQRRWTLHNAVDANLLALSIVAVLSLVGWIVRQISWEWIAISGLAATALGWVLVWSRRPTLFQAARLADVELGTADLLSTALQPHAGDGEFAAVICSKADAICRQRRVSEVRLPHRSARWRASAVLISGIAMNIVWLRQAVSSSDSALPDQFRSNNTFPVEMSRSASDFASAASEDHFHSQDREDSSAEAHAFGSGGLSHSVGKRPEDSAGAGNAETSAAASQRLPPIVGRNREAYANGQTAASSVSPERRLADLPLPARVVGSSSSEGSFAAAPPAIYRDLIRAYFSVSSH